MKTINTICQSAVGAAIATVAMATAAAAVTAGSFTADATEDYESYAGGHAVLTDLFGGTVGVTASAVNHASVDAGGWSDFRSPGSNVAPTSGTKFGTIYGFGGFTLDFTSLGGIGGFGGWATAAGSGDDVLEFYDLGGALLDIVTETGGFGPGDGSMVSFSFISDTKIGSIRLSGPETAFDDLAYALNVSTVPVPASLPLLVGAFAGAGFLSRRRRKAS